jgi:hypothetical protein
MTRFERRLMLVTAIAVLVIVALVLVVQAAPTH